MAEKLNTNEVRITPVMECIQNKDCFFKGGDPKWFNINLQGTENTLRTKVSFLSSLLNTHGKNYIKLASILFQEMRDNQFLGEAVKRVMFEFWNRDSSLLELLISKKEFLTQKATFMAVGARRPILG